MADICGIPFGACLVRVTRLDANGNVIAGENSYVTDTQVSVQVSPDIEAGTQVSVKNGCGCKIGSKRFPDTFNNWNLTLTLAQFQPTLIAWLVGGTTIEDGADTVGLGYPAELDCTEQAPKVAFEFWAENGVGSGLHPTHPYFHAVYPSSSWVQGDETFEEGAAQLVFNGVTQTNQNWGDGPYGDGPPDGTDISNGGVWASGDALPEAECGTQAVTSTS